MKVLIITGGTSSERKISFMSARQVKKGLMAMGHKAKLFDFKKGYKELKDLAENFDVIFPVLHGEEGEGGRLQKFLSTLNKPFVGGDPKGFKQGWYKIPFKEFCDRNNIPTASWKRLHPPSHSERSEESLLDPSSTPSPQDDNLLKSYCKQIVKFGFPCVVKSSSGGSSREVIILKSAKDLKSRLCKYLLGSGLDLFVEKFLPGTEVTVAILNNQALPVIEIIPPKGGWFDYKNKYSGQTQEVPHAPSLDEQTKQLTQKIALKIHQALNLGPYSRIDFIVPNLPYALEVNTIPGLTSQSLFPKAAQAVGISFPELLDKIIKVV